MESLVLAPSFPIPPISPIPIPNISSRRFTFSPECSPGTSNLLYPNQNSSPPPNPVCFVMLVFVPNGVRYLVLERVNFYLENSQQNCSKIWASLIWLFIVSYLSKQRHWMFKKTKKRIFFSTVFFKHTKPWIQLIGSLSLQLSTSQVLWFLCLCANCTDNDTVSLPKRFMDCIQLSHVDVFNLNTHYPYLLGEETGSRGTGQPSNVGGTWSHSDYSSTLGCHVGAFLCCAEFPGYVASEGSRITSGDVTIRTTLWAPDWTRSWNLINKNQSVRKDLGYHLVQLLMRESFLNKFMIWVHSVLIWIPPVLGNSLPLKSAYHIFLIARKSFLESCHSSCSFSFHSFVQALLLNYPRYVSYSSIGWLFQDENINTIPLLWVLFLRLNILSSLKCF